MTAVVGILQVHPGLAWDAAAAARLVGQEVQHLNRLEKETQKALKWIAERPGR